MKRKNTSLKGQNVLVAVSGILGDCEIAPEAASNEPQCQWSPPDWHTTKKQSRRQGYTGNTQKHSAHYNDYLLQVIPNWLTSPVAVPPFLVLVWVLMLTHDMMTCWPHTHTAGLESLCYNAEESKGNWPPIWSRHKSCCSTGLLFLISTGDAVDNNGVLQLPWGNCVHMVHELQAEISSWRMSLQLDVHDCAVWCPLSQPPTVGHDDTPALPSLTTQHQCPQHQWYVPPQSCTELLALPLTGPMECCGWTYQWWGVG